MAVGFSCYSLSVCERTSCNQICLPDLGLFCFELIVASITRCFGEGWLLWALSLCQVVGVHHGIACAFTVLRFV
jgi:hypothetical protein